MAGRDDETKDDRDDELDQTRELRRRHRAEDIRELWIELRKWRRWVHKLRNEVQIAVLVKDNLEKLETKLDARAEVTSTTLAGLETKLNEVSTVKRDFRAYLEHLEKEAAEKKAAEAKAAELAAERAKEKRTHRRWMLGILFGLVTVLLQFGLAALLKVIFG